MANVKHVHIEDTATLVAQSFSASPADDYVVSVDDMTVRPGVPTIKYHDICVCKPIGSLYTHGQFYGEMTVDDYQYVGSVYGVQWDTADPSPECTRIGNLSLHVSLPVQSLMVGGLLTDAGAFTPFSHTSDWTSETRNGSVGQVMVRIPLHYRKFEFDGTVVRMLLSLSPVIGFTVVPEQYVSAYEAALDRTNSKLCSVVNASAQYRGGNNQSAWDAEDTSGQGGESHRSQLGRPVTYTSLTNFRTYARNRKANSTEWNCNTYEVQRALYWLYVCEYATLNSQKAYDASTTTEGYRKGGLGDGVTTWDGTNWNNFNSYYPLVPCGWTDNIGNGTGVRNYTVYDASGTALKTFAVPRYRGVENPFGHIWKHTDGILCQVYSGTDGVSQVYATDNPADFSSTSYSAYRLIGNELRVQQYVSQLHLGENGDITAKAGGGNSTSYYCDYHYCNVENTGLRAVLFGGFSSSGTGAGLVCSYSLYAPSNTRASVGSRLCFLPSPT